MGAYAIRGNNNLPFVNGGISASIKSEQPQRIYSHEAIYLIRLYNLYYLFGGVLEAGNEFSAVRIRTYTQKFRKLFRQKP